MKSSKEARYGACDPAVRRRPRGTDKIQGLWTWMGKITPFIFTKFWQKSSLSFKLEFRNQQSIVRGTVPMISHQWESLTFMSRYSYYRYPKIPFTLMINLKLWLVVTLKLWQGCVNDKVHIVPHCKLALLSIWWVYFKTISFLCNPSHCIIQTILFGEG